MSKPLETCPVCGEKMEKGYVYHGAGIYWSKEKQKWLPKLDQIAAVRFVGYPHFLEGYKCKNCKLILFSYEKEQKKSKKTEEKH